MLISHDRRFLERISRATIWLDRGGTRRLDKGFAHFEEWRDQVLEEEEIEQHKLGRQIEREEHWLRYGVTARRKRNMRRLGNLQALRADFGMTRYQASALLSFQFNKSSIQRLVVAANDAHREAA